MKKAVSFQTEQFSMVIGSFPELQIIYKNKTSVLPKFLEDLKVIAVLRITALAKSQSQRIQIKLEGK